MTPAHGIYWERFYENTIGWHVHFPNLLAYTFDAVPHKSPLHRTVRQIDTLFDFEQSQQHSNLILASFQAAHQHNPHADWYFLVEDDTIVIKTNLDRLIEELSTLEQQQHQHQQVFYGNCVQLQDAKLGTINFVVGGGGILMSRALAKALAPHWTDCRREYHKVPYGDARLGACIAHKVHRVEPFDACSPKGYAFTNAHPSDLSQLIDGNRRVITLQEKDPVEIRKWNAAVVELQRQHPGNVTWRMLEPYASKKNR